MRLIPSLLALVFLGITGLDASAQGLNIFKRKNKQESPANKIKQAVTTLQTSPEESKRKQAAEELKGVDVRTYTDVIPALMSAIQRDPVPTVRTVAVETIGKLKPVSPAAGLVLEATAQADPDAGVREAAKNALWQYHLNGYRSTSASTLNQQTGEPPLATNRPGIPAVLQAKNGKNPAATANESAFRPINMTVGKGTFYAPTMEPPLAKPKNPVQPNGPAMPKGKAKPATQKSTPPSQSSPPASNSPVPTGPLPTITIPTQPVSK